MLKAYVRLRLCSCVFAYFSSASNNFVSCYSTVSKFNRIVQKLGIPEPPKKPVTGFIRFQKENLASIQRNAKSQPEVFAVAGEQWRQLSDDQKEKYNQVYKKEFVSGFYFI